MEETIGQAVRKYVDNHPNNKMKYPEWDGADAYDAFVAGAAWQAKQSPWINVEERLPEKDGLRVWVKSSLLNYQPLVYSKGKFYARLSDGAYDGGVTHWMPIPGLLEGATNEQ